MPINLIVLVASLLITWLLFNWTTKIIKVSVKTSLIIIAIVMVLQITLGISPQRLWDQVFAFPNLTKELINKYDCGKSLLPCLTTKIQHLKEFLEME